MDTTNDFGSYSTTLVLSKLAFVHKVTSSNGENTISALDLKHIAY